MELPIARLGSSRSVRFAGFAVLFLLLQLGSRYLVVEGPGGVLVPLLSPAVGVGLVWLAGARGRLEATAVLLTLVVLAAGVLALTGASGPELLLVLLSPLLYVVPVALMRRWLPHLWGSGGTDSIRTVRELGLTLVAMAAGVVAFAVARSLLGLVLLPEAETAGIAVARATRILAGLMTVGVVGYLVAGSLAGSLAEARRTERAPRPPDAHGLLHLAGAAAAQTAILLAGFGVARDTPVTFLLTLPVVWVALRLRPVTTGLFCLATGSVAVALTIAGVGPVAGIDDTVGRAAVAQALVVVLTVLGLVVSLSRSEVLDSLATLAQSEERERRRARELDLMMANLIDAVAVIEEGGRVQHANQTFQTMFAAAYDGEVTHVVRPSELPAEALMVRSDGTVLSDESSPLLRALAGEHVVGEEWLLSRPGRAPQSLSLSALPLPGVEGERRRSLVVVRDVTAERDHQESLAGFARTVAHDLSSPLLVIDGFADVIGQDLAGSTDPVVAAAADQLVFIRNGVRQMREFVSDLLAHAVSKDQALRCERVSLEAMVDHVAKGRTLPDLPDGALSRGELPDVWADPVLLRQLLGNLVGNAVKYVAPQVTPSIHVEARLLDDGWVEVSVEDNGIGIHPAQREKVFEDFHRASEEEYAGTGLGLAICKRTVERHGGTIRVEGNATGGSVFVLTLPATSEAFAAALAG